MIRHSLLICSSALGGLSNNFQTLPLQRMVEILIDLHFLLHLPYSSGKLTFEAGTGKNGRLLCTREKDGEPLANSNRASILKTPEGEPEESPRNAQRGCILQQNTVLHVLQRYPFLQVMRCALTQQELSLSVSLHGSPDSKRQRYFSLQSKTSESSERHCEAASAKSVTRCASRGKEIFLSG